MLAPLTLTSLQRLVQPPSGLVRCESSRHQTSDTRRMDWLTLPSGTNALRDTHADAATVKRAGHASRGRNSLVPDLWVLSASQKRRA